MRKTEGNSADSGGVGKGSFAPRYHPYPTLLERSRGRFDRLISDECVRTADNLDGNAAGTQWIVKDRHGLDYVPSSRCCFLIAGFDPPRQRVLKISVLLLVARQHAGWSEMILSRSPGSSAAQLLHLLERARPVFAHQAR
jgi:hypothetical protein